MSAYPPPRSLAAIQADIAAGNYISEQQLMADLVVCLAGTLNAAGRSKTEPLGIPGAARQLAAGASSANTELTSTCRRVSLTAVGADIRFTIGSTSQEANADTSHLILAGQTKDFAVPATPNIAVIRDAGTSGVLEVTELLEP